MTEVISPESFVKMVGGDAGKKCPNCGRMTMLFSLGMVVDEDHGDSIQGHVASGGDMMRCIACDYLVSSEEYQQCLKEPLKSKNRSGNES